MRKARWNFTWQRKEERQLGMTASKMYSLLAVGAVMVDWAEECPDSWWLFLMCQWGCFQKRLIFESADWVKKIHWHQCRWTPSNPWSVWIGQKDGGGVNVLSASAGTFILSWPQTSELLILTLSYLDCDSHCWLSWFQVCGFGPEWHHHFPKASSLLTTHYATSQPS